MMKAMAKRPPEAIARSALPEAIALKITTFSKITISTKYSVTPSPVQPVLDSAERSPIDWQAV
jgi:4-hydroxy-3-methylbut-2-en-1-yl diphosphate synthase IspG/GcpE